MSEKKMIKKMQKLSPQSGEHRPPTFWGIGGALQQIIFLYFGESSWGGLGEPNGRHWRAKNLPKNTKNRYKIDKNSEKSGTGGEKVPESVQDAS